MDIVSWLEISALTAFACSAALTGLVRHYSLRKSILDIPNERSSHTVPTPRGGGIAIVITFLTCVACFSYYHLIKPNLFYALFGGGLVIALLGYCDDVRQVNTRTRILLHFLVAGWALYWLGGYMTPHPWVSSFLALIGIVWCLNFYNFMDGIDGLASSQGIFVSWSTAAVLAILGDNIIASLFLLFGFTLCGFSAWNWPPAKIFLGDVGSGFIGYVFAVLGLYTVNNQLLPLGFWWLILAIFIWDATFTVVHRGLQGKRWYSAHREHAYQRLTALGASHKQVTLGIILINMTVLLPGAFLTVFFPTQSLLYIAASATGLWVIWFRIKSLTSTQ